MVISIDKCEVDVHVHYEGEKKGEVLKDIPKGYLAVLVGQGEEQERFVIPVIYVNHPLFMKLLKEAEEEYGFDQKGPIIIPCHVHHFLTIQCLIHKDTSLQHHHHLHHLPVWCFKD